MDQTIDDYTIIHESHESQTSYSDSDGSEDSFVEEDTVPVKDQAMKKIEFALADIKEQLEKNAKQLILRTSHDKSKFSLRYSARMKKKLDRDLYCLHQIYDLLENDKKSTKRELFYEHKLVYEVQRNLDSSIKSICELLDESRSNLNVLSCGRGCIRGAITFLVRDVGVIDARVQDVLITDELLFSDLVTEADFILVVEKDTVFQKLIDENFQQTFPRGILVTSKGYPDISTRNVLKMLCEKKKFPTYGLFDADPHGIEIYLTYKYGAAKETAEGRGAFVPSIQWIGLFPTDFNRFIIDPTQCLPLERTDLVKIENLIPRSILLGESRVTVELDWMMQNSFKMELEAINMCGPYHMGRYLIAPRILSCNPKSFDANKKDYIEDVDESSEDHDESSEESDETQDSQYIEDSQSSKSSCDSQGSRSSQKVQFFQKSGYEELQETMFFRDSQSSQEFENSFFENDQDCFDYQNSSQDSDIDSDAERMINDVIDNDSD
uniref:DNA topoisomerase (ATP-hydrolyzing) n=1 Tax=Caenorhabditis tropicalis TaxID=1561998 RepID=A0A1I7UCT1_9PELO